MGKSDCELQIFSLGDFPIDLYATPDCVTIRTHTLTHQTVWPSGHTLWHARLCDHPDTHFALSWIMELIGESHFFYLKQPGAFECVHLSGVCIPTDNVTSLINVFGRWDKMFNDTPSSWCRRDAPSSWCTIFMMLVSKIMDVAYQKNPECWM